MRAAESTENGSPTAETSAAESWVHEFIEGWRAPESVDSFVAHFERILDPEIRLVQPQAATTVGYRGFKEGFARPLFELVPDVHVEVHRWAAADDSILIELTVKGTLGGRPIAWPGVDRVTLRNGVAIERVTYLDPTRVLTAVAVAPRAWPAFLRFQVSQLANRFRKRGN